MGGLSRCCKSQQNEQEHKTGLKFCAVFLLFGLMLFRILPLTTAQAAEHDTTDVRIRVAFINPGYGDRGFWKDVRDTMQAAADQFGFDLVVFDSDRDWKQMAESANRVFAMNPRPDYIIAVNEHQQGTRIVLEAQERSIPVLMLLNDLTDEQRGDDFGRKGHFGADREKKLRKSFNDFY